MSGLEAVASADGDAASGSASADAIYSKKIEAPIYTPKGERPKVSELFDRTKTEQLIGKIEAAALPPEIDRFLRFAAERHTAFDFRQIAEFYCHAQPAVQRLFEQSALVIIDFDAAIENGFVRMTERLGAIADTEGFAETGPDA